MNTRQQTSYNKKTPRKSNTFSSTPANNNEVGDFQAGYFVMPDTETLSQKTTKPQRKQGSPSKAHGSPTKQHKQQPNNTNNRSYTSPQKQPATTGKDVDTTPVTLDKESSKRWAGGAFGNAPAPSSLPMPDFSFLESPIPPVTLQPVAHPYVYYQEPSPYYTPAQLSFELRRLLHIESAPIPA